MANKSLGRLLEQEGMLNGEQLREVVAEQEQTGKSLQYVLIRNGWVKEKDILKLLSTRCRISIFALSLQSIDTSLKSRIPARFAFRHKMVPVRMERETLTVAMADPLDIHALDDVRLLTECGITPVLSSEREIVKTLKDLYGVGAENVGDEPVEEDPSEQSSEASNANYDTDGPDSENAFIITFVNQIISDAYHDRATDIHMEPFEDDVIVRYRIDGVLYRVSIPPSLRKHQPEIVSRIKIMAEMNIAEKRLPQDGRILFKIDNETIDLRVSTLPILHGESIDLRILPRSTMLMGLEQLGLPPGNLERMEKQIRRPHGIILVTGPTGNGKTTTLYACLSRINTVDKKIITVEDPVEYQLKGINQVPVHSKIGLTFANGLRSILRQDPDVIMIGEIRDQETAEIAIRASLTGHLVFSTLHTNDSPGAITRLIDMGIEPYLVSSSIEAVLAQRLVRTLCTRCRVSYEIGRELLQETGLTLNEGESLFKAGPGCDECRHTGYHGRTGIYEMLVMDEDMRRIVLMKTSSGNIRKEALKKGMRTLRQDGWEKVRAGLTSVEEVLRVTQEEDVAE